jgi:hypothetical protein
MKRLMFVSKFNFSLVLFSLCLLSTPLHADETCAPIEFKAARAMNSLLKETIEGLEEQITLEETMKTNPNNRKKVSFQKVKCLIWTIDAAHKSKLTALFEQCFHYAPQWHKLLN